MSAAFAVFDSAPPTFPRTSRYRLGRAIAEGPMGAIYVGFQRGASGFERIVVVERTDCPRGALFAEIARTISFRHANVVSVADFEEHDGELYLVGEYVEGVSLARLVELASGGRLPPAIALRVALDVRRALGAIHDAGFAHRHVSADHVLVGSDGVARLTHFGLPDASAAKRGPRALPTASDDHAAFFAMLEKIGTSKKALEGAPVDSVASYEDVADFVEQVASESLAEQRSEIRANAFVADDTFEEVSGVRPRIFALPPEPAPSPEIAPPVALAPAPMTPPTSMKADLAKLALALLLAGALCLTTAFACGAFFR